MQHIPCLTHILHLVVTDGKQDLGGEVVGELDQDSAELDGDIIGENEFWTIRKLKAPYMLRSKLKSCSKDHNRLFHVDVMKF